MQMCLKMKSAQSLPGAFAQPVRRIQTVTPGGPARAKTVRIIGPDNGHGLSRDREILTTAFRNAGWRVEYAAYRDAHVQVRCAVNVHLENITHHLLGTADCNVVIPNPEWWQPAGTASLALPSVVAWVKTADAERMFASLGVRVERLGFCSVDRRSWDMQRFLGRKRSFLHLAGASPNKGTLRLAMAWQEDWPQLVIACERPIRAVRPLPSNVTIICRRLPDDAVRRLQNEFLFHIYPSEYEGFGHAQWEGLSCGSVVFAADAPPFDEHSDAFRLMASTCDAESRVGSLLARRRFVTQEALTAAVTWATAMSDAELAQACERSRTAWEASAAQFQARARALIEGCAGTRVDDSAAPRAMTYVGRVNCVIGQGAAARHQIYVLRKAGLRFRVVDAGSCASPDPGERDAFIQAARRSDAGTMVTAGTIFHLQPNMAEPFRRAGYPRPHVLVSVWETSKLPASWVAMINDYDQVWCATEWQRRVYAASGVREQLLWVVPFALDPDAISPAPTRVAGDSFVFGSVFQWSERKDPAGLLAAYLKAFAATDPVKLVLKLSLGDDPKTPVANRVDGLIKQLRPDGSAPRVEVIAQALDSADMAAFYASIDCYVSAHRGEGFGLPIAEALLHGRPVIATGWSAPAEYAAGLYRGVNYKLVPPHNMDWQPFYGPDQRWAQADQVDLVAALREAAAGQLLCDVDAVRSRFAALTVRAGEAARAALAELVR